MLPSSPLSALGKGPSGEQTDTPDLPSLTPPHLSLPISTEVSLLFSAVPSVSPPVCLCLSHLHPGHVFQDLSPSPCLSPRLLPLAASQEHMPGSDCIPPAVRTDCPGLAGVPQLGYGRVQGSQGHTHTNRVRTALPL